MMWWHNEGWKKTKWYDMHIKNERHHLTEHCPEDVNLIDVLEMIADGVMAGMGRSGSVYIQDLDPEILQKAYRNTFELLQKQVVVEAE